MPWPKNIMRLKPDFASLRTRLLLLVAGSLLPAIALLMFQGLRDYDLAKERLIQQAESFAYQIALFSKDAMPEPYDYLSHLATIPEVRQDGPGCSAFLASTLKATFYFDDIFVMHPSGKIICSGVALPASLHLPRASRAGPAGQERYAG